MLGLIGTVALVAAFSVVAAGSAGTKARAQVGTRAAIAPPRVPNAKAIRKKYGGQKITFIGDKIGNTHQRDLKLTARFTKDTGIKIDLIPHPASGTDAYAQLARNFSSHSSDVDLAMLDVVWPGAFATYLVDLKPKLGKAAKKHLQSIVQNDTVGGRLVAMPWFSDYGILYGERKSTSNFTGCVFQGSAYEGLTCDALEWIASSGGGHFFDKGKVSINNSKAAAILNQVRGWVGNIAPRGVTTYQETESLNVFDSGNAAFMRNWPYAYSASQTSAVKGKFGVTVLPHSGKNPSVATVGGWQLGVSKYSKHKGAAIELVRYLASPGAQKFTAIFASNPPTIPSVVSDKAVVRVNPWLKPDIAKVARVTRPSRFLKGKYTEGSQIIFQGINQILNGQNANSVLPGIASRLRRLVG